MKSDESLWVVRLLFLVCFAATAGLMQWVARGAGLTELAFWLAVAATVAAAPVLVIMAIAVVFAFMEKP